MVKEAEFVQKAIDMLLDLKQKQANIVEAEFARKQSEDTAKQSDTIMVFTVVTILFVSAYFRLVLKYHYNPHPTPGRHTPAYMSLLTSLKPLFVPSLPVQEL